MTTTAPTTIELQSLPTDDSRVPEHDHPSLNTTTSTPSATNEFPSLPPVDTGKQAWLFLAACWGVEAVTFGFGFSFGVFQDYYTSHAPFAGSPSIATIGTTTTSILYLGAPFIVPILKRYPRQARWATLVGLRGVRENSADLRGDTLRDFSTVVVLGEA
ncbi:hypothetical protein GRF29_8g3350383 [Pseudopithomyces chartarum]|uniref:Uncharacterized protein n=1 Tax=Pseudopithomyces chartarum TaxID=1892770 RepID=A0AAN6M8P7_9PLEO|nr:hypothetical protein GRF29_8g3350383 [Pseudopithomyces chartarum]